jgi:hypothetical protein
MTHSTLPEMASNSSTHFKHRYTLSPVVVLFPMKVQGRDGLFAPGADIWTASGLGDRGQAFQAQVRIADRSTRGRHPLGLPPWLVFNLPARLKLLSMAFPTDLQRLAVEPSAQEDHAINPRLAAGAVVDVRRREPIGIH